MYLKSSHTILLLCLSFFAYNEPYKYRCLFRREVEMEKTKNSFLHIIYVDFEFKCRKVSIEDKHCLKSITIRDLRRTDNPSSEIEHLPYLIPNDHICLRNYSSPKCSGYVLYKHSPLTIFTIKQDPQSVPYKALYNYKSSNDKTVTFKEYVKKNKKRYPKSDENKTIYLAIKLDLGPLNGRANITDPNSDFRHNHYYFEVQILYDVVAKKINNKKALEWAVEFEHTNNVCFKYRGGVNINYDMKKMDGEPDSAVILGEKENFSILGKGPIRNISDHEFYTSNNDTIKGKDYRHTVTYNIPTENTPYVAIYHHKVIDNMLDKELATYMNINPGMSNAKMFDNFIAEKLFKFYVKDAAYCIKVSYTKLKLVDIQECETGNINITSQFKLIRNNPKRMKSRFARREKSEELVSVYKLENKMNENKQKEEFKAHPNTPVKKESDKSWEENFESYFGVDIAIIPILYLTFIIVVGYWYLPKN